MAVASSSSVIKGAVTTLIIALVTGIAIAAFDVFIFAVCTASFNSSATLSGFSKTVPPSGILSNLCTKKRSRTHWFSLLFEICERRISLGVSSTPTISSPLTDDFPNLFFKNFEKNVSFFFLSPTGVGAGDPASSFFFSKFYFSKFKFFQINNQN